VEQGGLSVEQACELAEPSRIEVAPAGGDGERGPHFGAAATGDAKEVCGVLAGALATFGGVECGARSSAPNLVGEILVEALERGDDGAKAALAKDGVSVRRAQRGE
jgi:hypothetical protein